MPTKPICHAAQKRLEAERGEGQLDLHHANFRSLPELDLPQCDGILADLGLSSVHVDDPERGFSFRTEGPLDLRFDRLTGITAAQLIEEYSVEQIQEVLRDFGEVRQSRKMATCIKEAQPKTTSALRTCIEDVAGFKAPSLLPQVFQAFRIAVNEELTSLRVLLEHGPELLKLSGRIAIISFHSLEDRMVKQSFRTRTEVPIDDRTGQPLEEPSFQLVTKKPIAPSEDEIERNPRARSAKLRVLKRLK